MCGILKNKTCQHTSVLTFLFLNQILKQDWYQCKVDKLETNSFIGFIYTKCRRSIYLTIIRPHLGYSTQVWVPQSIYLISNLEKIQRQATKYILTPPFSCSQSYEQWLKTLSLLPIRYWHEYLDILLFFKITHGLVDIDPTIVPIAHSKRHT